LVGRFEEIGVGSKASLSKTITEEDVKLFATITGDNNPIHLDEEYAKKTIFKGRVAHGFLTAGMISAVLGTRLPGPGSIYLSQTLKFTAPVRIGDTITCEVEVIKKIEEKNLLILKTTCKRHDEVNVIEGEATTLLREV